MRNNRGGKHPSDSETQIEVAAGDSLASPTLWAQMPGNLPEEARSGYETIWGHYAEALFEDPSTG